MLNVVNFTPRQEVSSTSESKRKDTSKFELIAKLFPKPRVVPHFGKNDFKHRKVITFPAKFI